MGTPASPSRGPLAAWLAVSLQRRIEASPATPDAPSCNSRDTGPHSALPMQDEGHPGLWQTASTLLPSASSTKAP
jgi:hypothetical protein